MIAPHNLKVFFMEPPAGQVVDVDASHSYAEGLSMKGTLV